MIPVMRQTRLVSFGPDLYRARKLVPHICVSFPNQRRGSAAGETEFIGLLLPQPSHREGASAASLPQVEKSRRCKIFPYPSSGANEKVPEKKVFAGRL